VILNIVLILEEIEAELSIIPESKKNPKKNKALKHPKNDK